MRCQRSCRFYDRKHGTDYETFEYDNLPHVPRIGEEVFLPEERTLESCSGEEDHSYTGNVFGVTYTLPDEEEMSAAVYCEIVWENDDAPSKT